MFAYVAHLPCALSSVGHTELVTVLALWQEQAFARAKQAENVAGQPLAMLSVYPKALSCLSMHFGSALAH